MLLLVKTKVVKLGRNSDICGSIRVIRLFANNKVLTRRNNGKFPRTRISLSVRSIVSF